MNSGQFFVLVLMGMIMSFSIIRAKLGIRKDRRRNHYVQNDRDAQAVREEMRALRERIATLEAIVTDNASTLDRQIERLRDR